jgi:hypothetical protein
VKRSVFVLGRRPLLASLAAALALPPCAGAARGESAVLAALEELFGGGPVATEVGRRALGVLGDASTHAIRRGFLDKLSLASLGELPVDRLHPVVRGLVRSDFAQGDTVEIDGWVLARTEALAAALVARTRY